MKKSINTDIPANDRLDYLDAVRAFALLLGIAFHASLSFLPIYIGWAVMDISTSSIVGTFALISHSFRMELFFLVAGFFSHMTFHRKGAVPFLKLRLIRIGIPFVLGWIVLRPLLVSGWVMGMQSMHGDVSILAALREGFSSFLSFSQTPLTGTHLWFLYYLLLISASLLLGRALIASIAPLYASITQVSDRLMCWLCRSPMALIALAVPTAGCLWFMGQWGIDTPDKALAPHIPVYLIYGGFFVFGWLMHRQSDLILDFSSLTWTKVLLALVAIVTTVMLSGYESQSGHPQYLYLKIAFKCSYVLMMWSLVAITIGLFRQFFDRPSKTVRYIADSSYWLYLLHLPIVIWLQIALAEVVWHWGIKLTLTFVITIGVSLVLYDLCVRSTAIGAVLNGRRKSRVLFSARGNMIHC